MHLSQLLLPLTLQAAALATDTGHVNLVRQDDGLSQQAHDAVVNYLDELGPELRVSINQPLFENPETAFHEVFAHDTISQYLEDKGFSVTRGAYNLSTSMEATLGDSGPLVIFCAEYDALPVIGHSCGHNLIATSSVAAFLATANAMTTLNIPGRIRLLGTPAEEGGGGKIQLINNGAFDPPEDVSAAIMAHPAPQGTALSGALGADGLAGPRLIANRGFQVNITGQPAHAAAVPFLGRNALDAAVLAYNSISMMRQQSQPTDRMHTIITEGGTAVNVIPELARMSLAVRAPTINRTNELYEKIYGAIIAATIATNTTARFIEEGRPYSDLRFNQPLSQAYVDEMAKLGANVTLSMPDAFPASTDMGDVSYYVPTFHGSFALPNSENTALHNPSFGRIANASESHDAAITSAKGMALLALRVITNGGLANSARETFEQSGTGADEAT